MRSTVRRLKRVLPHATRWQSEPATMRSDIQLLVQHAPWQHGDRDTRTVAAVLLAACSALAAGVVFDRHVAQCESIDKQHVDGSIESEDTDDHATASTGYFDDDYEAKNLVGCGAFGVVMQCISKKDGHVAAVKMIQDLEGTRDEVEREKEALASIQQDGGHENIVQYNGAYQHDGYHYIVTEYVNGESLYSYIQKRHHPLDVKTALTLTAQLVSALSCLRAHGLIHCDLKPENIIIVQDKTGKLKVKLIDFGSAEYVTSSGPLLTRELTLSGTRCYWPPEVLLRQETSPAMDMWALGCILFIMIAGRHPFDIMGNSTESEIVHRITTESCSFLHPVWVNVPDEVKTLIRGLLEKDPQRRLTVEEVRKHPAIRHLMQ